MLTDASSDRVYLACGSTNLRKSIDGLAAIVSQAFALDPFGPLPVCRQMIPWAKFTIFMLPKVSDKPAKVAGLVPVRKTGEYLEEVQLS